ncbi:hypothetical protein B0H14DRAFT_2631502 [Mycena olivaceomarginata]|nr:hypothetical protein B0H14DRAFT_2631502 [Mycena olivaceomarginata]
MSSQKLTITVLGARSADSYFPTIDCLYFKKITVNSITYECRILDTAGQDESFILKEGWIYGTHVYVLVYSVASRWSFDLVRILYDNIFGLYGLPIPERKWIEETNGPGTQPCKRKTKQANENKTSFTIKALCGAVSGCQ